MKKQNEKISKKSIFLFLLQQNLTFIIGKIIFIFFEVFSFLFVSLHFHFRFTFCLRLRLLLLSPFQFHIHIQIVQTATLPSPLRSVLHNNTSTGTHIHSWLLLLWKKEENFISFRKLWKFSSQFGNGKKLIWKCVILILECRMYSTRA